MAEQSLIIKYFLPILILLGLSPLAAGSDKPKQGSCLEDALTQGDMNRCAHIDYQAADKELNRVYQQLIKRYSDDPVFIKKLRASQRAWIRLRDADFAMRYPHSDDPGYYGSAFPTCSRLYLTELTLARVAFLKQWLKGGVEGDLCNGSIKNQGLLKQELKN
jgi:uncharacterized protein YecT (DUF1311 family)